MKTYSLDYLGEHIGTVTAFVHADKNIGNVHGCNSH